MPPSPQPSSPALSISSIIRPTTSTFTGQSPAITPRTLSFLPQGSSQSQEGFQDQATLPLSDPAVRTRTEPQGRYRQAKEEQLLEELALIAIMLGESHSEYLEKSTHIVDIFLQQGRYRSAEEMIRKSISAFKTESRDDIYRLKAVDMLGTVLLYQGFDKEAEKILSETFQSQKRVLGTENPSTLMSMHKLALAYAEQRRLKEAEDLLTQVLETRRRILGQDHINTMKCMDSLARVYRGQKRWMEAEDLGLQVIERQTRVLGREHLDTQVAISGLALLYMDEGRLKEAGDLEVQVLETRTRVLGQEHPDTLASMHNLAWTWNGIGRFADSIKLMEECGQLRIRILGASHPDTLYSKEFLLHWQRGN
jgi:tetratricopeptide (TPR) repeat protein